MRWRITNLHVPEDQIMGMLSTEYGSFHSAIDYNLLVPLLFLIMYSVFRYKRNILIIIRFSNRKSFLFRSLIRMNLIAVVFFGIRCGTDLIMAEYFFSACLQHNVYITAEILQLIPLLLFSDILGMLYEAGRHYLGGIRTLLIIVLILAFSYYAGYSGIIAWMPAMDLCWMNRIITQCHTEQLLNAFIKLTAAAVIAAYIYIKHFERADFLRSE